MLAPKYKIVAATILAMLKVGLAQLKELSARINHEKISTAVGHLEQCVAEVEDACLETR